MVNWASSLLRSALERSIRLASEELSVLARISDSIERRIEICRAVDEAKVRSRTPLSLASASSLV